jgi:shikimate kinase
VDPGNRAALRKVCHLVVLEAPMAVLAQRVAGDRRRPLWDADVGARYEARRAAYADRDFGVDTSEMDPDAVVEEIVRWLGTAG